MKLIEWRLIDTCSWIQIQSGDYPIVCPFIAYIEEKNDYIFLCFEVGDTIWSLQCRVTSLHVRSQIRDLFISSNQWWLPSSLSVSIEMTYVELGITFESLGWPHTASSLTERNCWWNLKWVESFLSMNRRLKFNKLSMKMCISIPFGWRKQLQKQMTVSLCNVNSDLFQSKVILSTIWTWIDSCCFFFNGFSFYWLSGEKRKKNSHLWMERSSVAWIADTGNFEA